jgi:hypothetical protein
VAGTHSDKSWNKQISEYTIRGIDAIDMGIRKAPAQLNYGSKDETLHDEQ